MASLILWSLVAVLGITALYFWFIRKKETPEQPQSK